MKRFIPFVKSPPRVAVIRLQGAIGTGRMPLNDEALAPVIEKAFKRGKPTAVALLINSPGGSPVQSARIAGRIRRLAEEKEIPVHAFVEDVAASGGYWLACAADDIFADPASIIGSIGVISGGFGAHDFIAKHGIERRIYTAGTAKSQLDMFKPEQSEDVARLKAILEQMHAVFIDHVKTGRGDRLADEDVFTGEFWLAGRGLELGLIDGIGHLEPKLKELYGDDVQLIPYGRRKPWASRFGMQLAGDAMAAIEERALLSRYGL
ncbi:S49 family peptidase [Alisedimentitalea sp. MJ-SS2]|uniref:S49 family peptidase n=1 Tax=Aliisedimentitalea sp. MJ-SS2 TaxID=3049795 RepID=UPI00290B92A4|nr:S49 family peptidase [Alisedimentitalea sp. MJ-SS2]MDU8928471.1 S49 family peptidase [Alisedimentitalea sp. MJ-SS2]